MNLLLDTQILLWWLDDNRRLSAEIKEPIAAPNNTVFVSAVSVWEIRIKQELGKLSVPANLEEVLAHQLFEPLPITWRHAHSVGELPRVHRDPFDRMLVAQALAEHLTLVSSDRILKRYGIDLLLA